MSKQMIKLHNAAVLFVNGKTVSEIAGIVGVSARTIGRWAETQAWHETLNKLGYEGDRKLRRQPRRDLERDSGDLIQLAKSTYMQVLGEGCHPRNAATHVANRTGIDRQRVAKWAKKLGWRGSKNN